LARAGLAEIEGRGSAGGDPFAEKPYAMHAHGAVFAEVKVDPELGQVRATRLVGAFAAGTIINPRLVRSQYYGGHCQLRRPWYAPCVGGTAARGRKVLCSPIVLPRSNRAGPQKGALAPLS
jgi:Molybdopterin-binding domain of aldehyde dehydrogenase